LENVNIIFHQAFVYDTGVEVVGTQLYSCNELHGNKVNPSLQHDTPRVLFPNPRIQKTKRQYARMYSHDTSPDNCLPSPAMSTSSGAVYHTMVEAGPRLGRGLEHEPQLLQNTYRPYRSPAPSSVAAMFRSHVRSPPWPEQQGSSSRCGHLFQQSSTSQRRLRCHSCSPADAGRTCRSACRSAGNDWSSRRQAWPWAARTVAGAPSSAAS
jgi:hypothetical protein